MKTGYMNRTGKRAQMEMGETIAVLFVFILIVMIGFVVYVQFQLKGEQEAVEEARILGANEVAQRASYLPELSCSAGNVPVFNCFDILKLDVNEDEGVIAGKRSEYYDLLRYSRISVEQIYPPPASPEGFWTIYDNVPDDTKSKKQTLIPVSLLNPSGARGEEYYFGLMKVDTYYQ
ncbi:MAG: hypothetical protein ABIC95_04740 [archaeon]